MAKLADDAGYVYVLNERGSDMVAFGPGDDVPEWAARKMGAHVFPDSKHPYPPKAAGDGGAHREASAIPPKGGPGSGTEAWAAYAGEVGVTVAEDASREDIITAIKAAGKPTEYED